jgi:Homeodomain-like domain
MPKLHVVRLSPKHRAECGAILRRGRSSALAQRRARILLAADVSQDGPRLTDGEIAAAVQVQPRTVARVRAALRGRPRPRPVPPKLDAVAEARLIALACTTPPAGRDRWSLRLLADQVVLVEGIPPVSRELIRRTLKKTTSSPGWCGDG